MREGAARPIRRSRRTSSRPSRPGPWIRLYSFSSLRVLNAQLQAVDLAAVVRRCGRGQRGRRRLPRGCRTRAASTLSSFDTGYWTYYALPYDPSPLDYQQYVVQLLRKLASTDPRFADAATRIAQYEKQPPAFKLATGSLGALRFWLSKPATVQANTGAGPTKRITLDAGWHTFGWGEPKRPGVYPVHVTAVDSVGNKASFDALPIVRVISTAQKPPAKKRSTLRRAAPCRRSRVGAGLDDPSQGLAAQNAGLRLARIGVAVAGRAAAPDPGLIAALQQTAARARRRDGVERHAASGRRRGTCSARPVRSVARAASAGPALSHPRARRHHRDGDVIHGSTHRLRQSVQAAVPTALVGLAVDGSANAKATIAALAGATADVVAFRPAPAPGKGLWTFANLPQLSTAFETDFGVVPPVLVDGLARTIRAGDRRCRVHAGARRRAPRPSRRRLAACDRRGNRRFAARHDSSARVSRRRSLHRRSSTRRRSRAGAPDPRVRPRLPVPRHARRRGRPAGRGAPRRASRRRGAGADHVAEGEARAGAYTFSVQLVAQVNPGAVTKLESPPLPVG